MSSWPVLNAARNHGVLNPDGKTLFIEPNDIREGLGDQSLVPFHLTSIAPLARPWWMEGADLAELGKVRAPFPMTWNEFVLDPLGPDALQASAAVLADFTIYPESVVFSMLRNVGGGGRAQPPRNVPAQCVGSLRFDAPAGEVDPAQENVYMSADVWKPTFRMEEGNFGFTQEAIAALMQHMMLPPVLFAWALLACRNVELVEVHPSTRRPERMADPDRIVYRELKVNAVSRRATRAVEGEHQSGVAFHIVRGHFKTYEGKGLFGRYKGRWWFGQHTAGDPDFGTVLKTYKVRPS